MYKFYVLIILYLGSIQLQFSQSNTGENLAKKIKLKLQQARKMQQLDSALYYVNQAIALSNQSSNDSLIIGTYYNKPLIPAILGDFDKTLMYLKEFDSVLKQHYHPYYDFRHYTLYAYAYSMKNNYDLGLQYNLKSIEMAKKNKDERQLAEAYNNIGKEYMNLDEPENSFKYLKLADSLYHKIMGHGTYILYNNMSQVAGNFKEAKKYSEKAYQLLDTTDLQDVALFYLVRSDAYQTQKHYKESLEAGKKCYNLSKRIQNKMLQNTALIYMGKNYHFLNRLDSAIVYLEKGLQYDKESLSNKLEIARMLSKTYEKKHQYKKALKYHKLYVQYNDSIKDDVAKQKYAEFNIKYETAKKDKELAAKQLLLSQQQNRINQLSSLGIFGLLVLLAVFQWFFYKQKKKKIMVVQQLEKAKEINMMRHQFLGNIAHEIRTPLTLILGNLELAMENMQSKKKLQQYLKSARNNAKRVIDEANQILELLKSDQKKHHLKPEVILIKNTINRMVLSFKSLMQMKNIELVFDNQIPASLSVAIDVDKLEKIVNNLLSNAIKYSPSESQIIIEALVKAQKLVFKVKDFGQGIKASELDKIFERFYQTKANRTVGGIGIGLALAQEFAQMMQGKIKVQSKAGEGSLFVLELPLKIIDNQKDIDKKQQLNNHVAKEESDRKNHKKDNILIVEDNPEMSAYLSDLLCPSFHCYKAFDGEEALEILKNQKIDLITSDIMMPKMDGMQFLQKLKKDKVLAHIPVIMISAKSLEEEKLKAFAIGINDYIIKPFSKNELLARVQNILKTKQQWEQWLFKEKELIDDTRETYAQNFLEKLEKLVLQNLSDETYKIADLAGQMGYSQRQLTRLVKKYTGLSPVQYILELRLQKAYAYIKSRQHSNLSDVRFKVGLNSASYFNKKFKQRFGVYPRDLI